MRVLALVFITCSFDAAAQDALRPIAPALRTPSAHQEAPVGGGDPILPDIVTVRGAVHGIGSADSVRIALDIHFVRIDRDSLTFPTAGLRVDSARVDGRSVRPVRGPGYTTVPVRADSSHNVPAPADRMNDISDERRVTLFYVVKSGLNRRHDGVGPTAVWTTPGNVDSHWLPLPSASDDLLHADLAFPLPPDWTLVNDPDTGGDSTGVHVLRPVEAVTARDLGFQAVRTDALHGAADSTGDADPVVYGIGSGVLDRPADSLRADIRDVSDFLAGRLSLSITPVGMRHVLAGGSPSGGVGPGVAIHGDAPVAHADPWMADFVRIGPIVEAVLSPSLTRLPTMDLWIREAVVAWLAAGYVRHVHGEAAFADVMHDLRVAYLDEAAARRRPLVWDRWSSPVDLIDMHARGRGTWTFSMLESVVGRDALLSGLDAFLDLPDDRLRDSESLRESLEEYSNEDLSPFFDAWVYGAGHPVLKVSSSHNAAGERLTVRIEQVQDGDLVPAVFPMHVGIRFASIEGVTGESIRIDDTVTETSFTASIEPNYLHVDTRAAWLFEFSPAPTGDDLVSMLRDDEEAASRVRTYRMITDRDAGAGLLFGARRVVESESDPIARAVGLSVPGSMAPAASAERMLLDHASDPSAIVRARVLRELGAFESTVVGERALQAANSDSNPLVLAAAVPVLIDRRPAIAWDVIESALVTVSPRHRVRLEALRLISDVDHSDTERLATLLEHTGKGQPFAVRRTAALEAATAFPADARVGRLVTDWLSHEGALFRLTALDMLAAMPQETSLELRRKASAGAPGIHAEYDPDPFVRGRLGRWEK